MDAMACNNCGGSFQPQRAGHVYCADRVCFLERACLSSRRRRKLPAGRECKRCGRSDREVGFTSKSECTTCASIRKHNGLCGGCGRPRRKYHGKPLCFNCDRDVTVSIMLHHGQRQAQVRYPGDWATRVDGNVIKFSRIRNLRKTIHLLVDADHFKQKSGARCLAVKGISPPSFPRDLAFMHRDTLDLFYDVTHYIVIGECSPFTFMWWQAKFKSHLSETSALRAWDRFKLHLKMCGIGCRPSESALDPRMIDFDQHRFAVGVLDFFARED